MSPTCAEAKQAVAKVRAARGYFDPSSMKGTGKGFGGKQSKGKGPTSKSSSSSGTSRTTFRPCFICGSPHHGYQQCPDRFAPKGGSGGPMGASKGKKGKSKGYFKAKGGKRPFPVNYAMEYFVDVEPYADVNCSEDLGYINVLSLEEDWHPSQINPAEVIVDTGVNGVSGGDLKCSKAVGQLPEPGVEGGAEDKDVGCDINGSAEGG